MCRHYFDFLNKTWECSILPPHRCSCMITLYFSLSPCLSTIVVLSHHSDSLQHIFGTAMATSESAQSPHMKRVRSTALGCGNHAHTCASQGFLQLVGLLDPSWPMSGAPPGFVDPNVRTQDALVVSVSVCLSEKPQRSAVTERRFGSCYRGSILTPPLSNPPTNCTAVCHQGPAGSCSSGAAVCCRG